MSYTTAVGIVSFHLVPDGTSSQHSRIPFVFRFFSRSLVVDFFVSVTRYSNSGFFLESVSPKTMSIPLGPFQILSKIRGDIRSSR